MNWIAQFRMCHFRSRWHQLRTLLLVALASCLLAIPVSAAERITAYAVNIKVLTNGELAITENISVRAEGNQIRRGIFRDIPTVLQDNAGQKNPGLNL